MLGPLENNFIVCNELKNGAATSSKLEIEIISGNS